MSDITPADALREVMDGDYPMYAVAAAKKAAEEATDWRPLAEDVTMHTMAFVICGDRMCGYHARLGVWTFDGTKECLRKHPTIAEILACAPGDEESP